MSKCSIYLGDLIHNNVKAESSYFPLGVACVAAYARKFFDNEIDVRLFKFADDILDAIKKRPPHILGLSNYLWNENLNRYIASWVKRISPETVVVFGGPNYPAFAEEIKEFFVGHADMDFYVQLHGEKGFVSLLERYFKAGSLKEMKSSPISNCVFYDYEHDKLITTGRYEPMQDLSDVPSPYLSGLLDQFFETSLAPLIETNRGCPYSCSYCTWSKEKTIRLFPLNRVFEEIEYIASRTKNSNTLYICDSNFGIVKRDLEIAGYLGEMEEKYGFPKNAPVAWAHKKSDIIIRLAEAFREQSSVTCSLQSMDSVVLKNIKRTNIGYDEFVRLVEYFWQNGIRTHTELILGLPDESRESHIDALQKLLSVNIGRLICYNLMLLNGSELNSRKNREKYGFKTKFRLIEGQFGRYNDKLVFDYEEIVNQTNTLSSEEILFFRPVHFLIYFLWGFGYYKELLQFMRSHAVNPVDFIINLIEEISKAPEPVRNVFADYVVSAHNELFNTADDLIAYFSEENNFTALKKGGFANLNRTYSSRILLEIRRDFEDYMVSQCLRLIDRQEKDPTEARTQLKNIMYYLNNRMIDFSTDMPEQNFERIVDFDFDILAWSNSSCEQSLSGYYRPGTRYRFFLSKKQNKILSTGKKRLQGQTDSQALRKILHLSDVRDLFFCVEYA